MSFDDIHNKTIWSLPKQPLPASDTSIVSSVFVTIWFVVSGVFAGSFVYLLYYRQQKTWPEFKNLMIGSGVLCFWYLVVVIDRWMHHFQNSVHYGYILLLPFWDAFYVYSTILTLWGTYEIVWYEVDFRVSDRMKVVWWFSAKFCLFILFLMSVYYVVVEFALSIVWMNFDSLNSIADVATKRTGFEIAMTAFFFAFSLILTGVATYAIVFKGKSVDGERLKTRLLLWFATILLLARSTSQFGIVIRAYGPHVTRQDTQLSRDISYGLLTSLYLLAMLFLAFHVSSDKDRGKEGVSLLKSDIRKHILEELDRKTSHAETQSPQFSEVIREAKANLPIILARGPLSLNSGMSDFFKGERAIEYLDQLDARWGDLNPREGGDYDAIESRNTTPFSVLTNIIGGRRRSAQSHRNSVHEGGLRTPNRLSGQRVTSQERLGMFRPIHPLPEEPQEQPVRAWNGQG